MEDRTCPKCNLFCYYPSKLKIHFEKSYHCKKSEDDIKDYFLSIQKDADIKCIDCNKKFSRKDSLQRHLGNSKCIKLHLDLQNTNIISNIPIPNVEITNNTGIIINNTINNDIINFNYIYLIEKFDVNNKEYIYKFGKTNRECSKRLKEHGDEAKVLLIIDVDNCNIIEKKILNILRNTINIKQCSFGNEYFLCNDKEFIKNIILKNI